MENNKRIALAPFSPSKLNTFEDCGEAYSLQYEQKVPSETFEPQIEGRKSHNLLEELSRSVREGEEIVDVSGMGKTLGLDDFLISRIKAVIYPDSFLSAPAGKVIIEGKLAINRDFEPVSWEDGWLRGVIDLAWPADGTFGPVFRIRDWKTGYKVPNQQEIEKELQCAIYALLIACHFDDIFEFEVEYYYIRSGAVRKVLYTLDDVVGHVYKRICDIEEGIRSGKRRANIGPHCANCTVRRACRHYAKAFHDGHALKIDSDESAVEAAETYLRLKAMSVDLEKQLRSWSDEHGFVQTSKGGLGYVPSEKISYPFDAAREILLEHGVDEEKIQGDMSFSATAMRGIIGTGKKSLPIWNALGAVEKKDRLTKFTTKKDDGSDEIGLAA